MVLLPISRPHTFSNIVNTTDIDNIIDRVRTGLSIILSIILNVCALILLTSIKMCFVNITIDNFIERVGSAERELNQKF